jgi:hypothetical protein
MNRKVRKVTASSEDRLPLYDQWSKRLRNNRWIAGIMLVASIFLAVLTFWQQMPQIFRQTLERFIGPSVTSSSPTGAPISPPQMTVTCQFTSGRRKGQTCAFGEQLVAPTVVGLSCTDGKGSYGRAVPDYPPAPLCDDANVNDDDDASDGQSLNTTLKSSICHFTKGPRAGQSQDYSPMPPSPLGTLCQDGMGSFGFVARSRLNSFR